MKKELEIKVRLDRTEFDAAVESMQKKLKEISTLGEMGSSHGKVGQGARQQGIGGGMHASTVEAFSKATQQSKREMDQLVSDQLRSQEKLGKEIVQRTELLKKLQIQQRQVTKDSQEEVALKEKIGQVEKNNNTDRERYQRSAAAMADQMRMREEEAATRQQGIKDRNPSGWGRAGRFASQGMYGAAASDAYGAMGGMGGIASGLAGFGGFMAGTGKLAEQYTGYGMRLESAKGSAIQGTVGQDLARVYAGKSPFETAFMPEREKAAGMAEQKSNRNRVTDRMMGIGGGAMLAAGAIGLGSIALAPFTGGTSLMGLGMAGGLAAGGGAMLANDRSRKGIFGGKEYDQLLASQRAKDFRETLEDLKNQDPAKKIAIESFEQDYMKNLAVQRTLGISNKQFYGENGLLHRGAQAGFLPDQVTGMAQGIVGAGGSARMGQQAQFGLQMERSGLTNASQLLGTLSGGVSSPEANKKAMVGIISEAFQIGLDNTDFAEEQRRFSQAAVQVISRTGATSEQDQDRIIKSLGMFVGERTNVGVQSAQSAYERFQERGSQVGGRRGALRMMDALQDPNLKKIPTNELTELLGMRPEELKEESDVVQYFAKQAGLSPKELINKVNRGAQSARFLMPGSKEKVEGYQKTINDYMSKEGLTRPELEEKQKAGELPEDVSNALGGLKVRANMEEKGGLTARDSAATVGEFLEGAQPMTVAKRKEATGKMLESTGDRVEDKVNASGAEGADKLRQQFVLLLPELSKAVTAVKAFAEGAGQAGELLHKESANLRSNLPSGDAYLKFGVNSMIPNASVQPQGGKNKK